MTNPDVVDILLDQHDRLRRLCDEVEHGGGDKRRLFAEFELQVNVHERGEEAVAHPATRQATAKGDEIGRTRRAEERRIEWALGELHELGTAHAAFDGKFADLRVAIVEHMNREEQEEFPLLRRYFSAERLHRMAGELADIEILTAR
jgi:hypothetical protein